MLGKARHEAGLQEVIGIEQLRRGHQDRGQLCESRRHRQSHARAGSHRAMKHALGLSTLHDNYKEAINIAGSFGNLVDTAKATPEQDRTGQ